MEKSIGGGICWEKRPNFGVKNILHDYNSQIVSHFSNVGPEIVSWRVL